MNESEEEIEMRKETERLEPVMSQVLDLNQSPLVFLSILRFFLFFKHSDIAII